MILVHFYSPVDFNFSLLSIPQDGTVLVWKFNVADNTFEPAASLSGHTLPVVSLISGADRLYSASMDHTIRVSLFASCNYTFICLYKKRICFPLTGLV